MKKLLRLLVLNGPNLNMLGMREPATYGKSSLKDVEALCSRAGKAAGFNVDCRQTNLEGELVSWIQQAKATYAGIIINAGGYSHSSVAILDALLLVKLPIIEVHISNIYAREEFRHNSLVSRAASGVICGLGINGYSLAIRACAEILNLSKR